MKSKFLTAYTFSLLLGISTSSSFASDNILELDAPTTNKAPLLQTENKEAPLSLVDIRTKFIDSNIPLDDRLSTYNPAALFEKLSEETRLFQPLSQGKKKLTLQQKEELKNQFYASRFEIGMWCFAFQYFITDNMLIPEGKIFFDALLDVTKPLPSSLPQGKKKKEVSSKKTQKKPLAFGYPIPGTNANQRTNTLEPLYEYLSRAQEMLDTFKVDPFPQTLTVEKFLSFVTKQDQSIKDDFSIFVKEISTTSKIPFTSSIFSLQNLKKSFDENSPLLEMAVKFRTPCTKGYAEKKGTSYYKSSQFDEAEKWFHYAIQLGSAQALNNLGVLVETENPERAMELYTQAVKKGFSASGPHLADLLYNQGKIEEAKKVYQEAADNNHVESIYNLAVIARNEGNSQEARKLYQRAAEKGHLESSHVLATFFLKEENLEMGKKWSQKAAEKGLPPQCTILPLYYKKKAF